MAVTLNASTSSGFIQTADTSGEIFLQNNGTTRLTVNASGVTIPTLTTTTVTGTIVQGTAVASTSGTSIDFTGIPSWVKRITVMLNAVATSGTAVLQIQLGDSGGVETTGYVSNAQAGGAATPLTSGFGLAYTGFTAGTTNIGVFVINLIGSNSWAEFGNLYNTSTITVSASAGAKTLSATLDRVRITTVGSTDTFTAGTINIQYEG